ncbi:MAG: hypothetical protein GWO88_00815 [Planctomycetia bacterium]|nr:hypothetical protein [Planctomycetia bacterium]
MTDQSPLHSSIVAMVSLASGIASNHPDMGQCQLERLRHAGVPEHQIDAVIEIARHIRDEASEKLDHAFNEKSQESNPAAETDIEKINIESSASCCSSTVSGQSCC